MKTVQLIVECSANDEWERKINQLGRVKYRLPLINSYVLEIPESSVEQLKHITNINAIYKTTKITAQMNSVRKIVDADSSLSKGLTGRGVTIAVLDTGVSILDDFTKPRNRLLYFKDFISGKTEFYDNNGHGTHVSVLKPFQKML